MIFIFYGIKSTVEIAWDVFRILADYRLRHLVNNVAINTHDYIRMEITVLYLKISWHQLSI
jgi:transcriptional regulator of met regulon